MSYCMKCGKELPDEAEFCSKCGTKRENNDLKLNDKRKFTFDGVVHKCPNCGEILKAFSAVCSSCGYELRDVESSKIVKQFNEKLLKAKNEEEKIKIIKTVTIPNSKEDILEFMGIAEDNFDIDYYVTHLKEEDEHDAWLNLMNQCCRRAQKALLKEDFEEIQQRYQEIKTRIQSRKVRNRVFTFGSIAMIIIGAMSSLLEITAVTYIGMAFIITGIVILVLNKKKDSKEEREENSFNTESKQKCKKGFSSWTTTAKVLWVILNIYTIGIPHLIYMCKKKDE